MKRYTLQEREEQIKFHRSYIENMIQNYEEFKIGIESDYTSHAITIYRNLLDHLDEVFGKEETE